MVPPSPTPGIVEVRAHGFSKPEWQVQKAVLIFGPIDFFFIVFVTIGGATTNTVPKIVLAIATIIFADLLLLEIAAHPRRVVMAPEGVTFRFRFHAERRFWDSFGPTLKPMTGTHAGGWLAPYTSIGRLTRGRTFGYWLTPDQARELLRYPSRKAWSWTPEMVELVDRRAR